MAKQKLQDGGEYIVNSFYGLKTAVKNPKELAPGQPQDSLNYITGYNTSTKKGDNIQLRTGSTLLCKTRLGAGKVSSFAVGQDVTGKQWPFFVANAQAYYYNPATADLAQVSGSALTKVEDMSMQFYQNLFGAYMYLSSPSNGMNLISVANKQLFGSGTFGGYFTIRQNFMWMWDYINSKTNISYQENLLQSSPDQVATSDSSIQNPQGFLDTTSGGSTPVQGNGVLTAFSGFLPFGSYPIAFQAQIGAPINSFPVSTFIVAGLQLQTINYTGGDVFNANDYVVIQNSNFESPQVNDVICVVISHGAGSITVAPILAPASATNGTYTPAATTVSKLELFSDDSNGNLKSLLGSTGTINYITGAITINTQTAVPNGLNVDAIYFSGTPNVISFSAANSFRQSGGTLQGAALFGGQIYSFLTTSTWLLAIGATFAATTQQQWRGLLGIPYFRSNFEVDEGILILDNTQQQSPKLRVLQVADFASSVEAESYSDDMDFSLYSINTAVTYRAGNYDLLSMQSSLNGVPKGYNDTTFLRNTISGFYDKLDYRISCVDVYNGNLLAGDTISQNLYALFSGQDDDGSPINNYWTSGQDDFGFDGLKRFGFFHIDGYIGESQVLNIYLQFDTGQYVLIGSVYGNGKYVDMNNAVLIGLGLGGLNPVGGAGNGQIYGYHFEQDIPIWTPLFQYLSVKFIAGVNLSGKTPKPAFGALQINQYGVKDIRLKSTKALAQNIGR